VYARTVVEGSGVGGRPRQASELRASLVERLAARLPVDHAWFFRLGGTERGLSLTSCHTSPDLALDRVVSAARAVLCHGQDWSDSVLSLTSAPSGVCLADAVQSSLQRQGLRCRGAHTVVEGNALRGSVLLLDEVRPLRSLQALPQGWAHDVDVAVLHARRRQPRPHRVELVCDSLGTPHLGCDAADPWRTHPLLAARLTHWIRAARAGREPLLGLAECEPRVRELRSWGGAGPHYLVQLQPVPVLVRQGRHHLTPRQRTVAGLAAVGAHNHEIADALGLAPGTVKVHLRSIFRVLGVGARTELAEALEVPVVGG